MTVDPGSRPGVPLRLVGVGRSAPDGRLEEFDLDLAGGELVALLDPSGGDARGVLRLVAGVDRPDTGSVLLGGRDVTGRTEVPAGDPELALVPAAPRLALRRTVAGAALPGRRPSSRADREALRRRSAELLAAVGLADRAERRLRTLPGPDRWWVGLVRALCSDPAVLLLEDPLAALGGAERLLMRDRIRRLQLQLGVATLVAGTDAADALALADRVAVFRNGRLEQLGTPDELYERPATAFVAGFVGTMNRIPAVLGDGDVEFLGVRREILGATPPPGAAVALVRPEGLLVVADGRGHGRVVTRTFSGAVSRIAVALPGGLEVLADLPSVDSQDLTPGTAVTVTPAERPALVAAAEPVGEEQTDPAAAGPQQGRP